MWYPINGGDLPTEPLEGGNNVPIAITADSAPLATDLKDWVQTEKDLSVEETLYLGFAPFNLEESGSHRTIVLDAMRYVDKDRIRWGVGVRLTLHAWAENAIVKGSVALVAAQASLNMAYTRSSFQVLGYGETDLAEKLPSFAEMSVTSYAALMKAIDECRGLVLSAMPAKLTPTPIAVCRSRSTSGTTGLSISTIGEGPLPDQSALK